MLSYTHEFTEIRALAEYIGTPGLSEICSAALAESVLCTDYQGNLQPLCLNRNGRVDPIAGWHWLKQVAEDGVLSKDWDGSRAATDDRVCRRPSLNSQ